ERSHRLRRSGKGGDPMSVIADAVTEDAWLLCFDEFQVDNITDAMILGRLFEALFVRGVVVVATSNVEPRNLYREGLQRENFLPFIDLIEQRCEVVAVDGGRDYRLARLKGKPTYHVPPGPKADAALAEAFDALTDGAPARPLELKLKGRKLAVPVAARGVARFDFPDLCDRPLGPADFLAIAKTFHTVIVANIPRLQPEHRDQARRFVTLIDALYEHRVNLYCSAEALPDALYPQGQGAFQFQRTASRLMEMQAEDYIAQPHAGAAGAEWEAAG